MQYFKKVEHYLIQKVIGSGAFAIVYQGVDENTKEVVAVKEINIENLNLDNPDDKKQFQYYLKEMQILRSLSHPNIIRLVDTYDKSPNYLYMMLEYCSKGDLDKFIKKNTPKGRLTESEAQPIFIQIVDAMKILHEKNIVHRDLKLANILIDDKETIKIADFGFALQASSNIMFKSYCGTPITMAPEILCHKEYDKGCDTWSLGVMLYQMLFGTAPFHPKKATIEELLWTIQNKPLAFPESVIVSDLVKDLIRQLLVVNPANRITFSNLLDHPWISQEKDLDNLLRSQIVLGNIEARNTMQAPQLSKRNTQEVVVESDPQHQLAVVIASDLRSRLQSKYEMIRIIEKLIEQIKNDKEMEEQSELVLSKLKSSLQVDIQVELVRIIPDDCIKVVNYKAEVGFWLFEMYGHFLKNDQLKAAIEDMSKLWEICKGGQISNSIVIRLDKEYTRKLTEQQQSDLAEEIKMQLGYIEQPIKEQIDRHRKEYSIDFVDEDAEELSELISEALSEMLQFRLKQKVQFSAAAGLF